MSRQFAKAVEELEAVADLAEVHGTDKTVDYDVPDEDVAALVTTTAVSNQHGIPTFRRPDKEDWVSFNRSAWVRNLFLRRRKPGTEWDVDYFFFAEGVRESVLHKLVPYVVLPFYSWTSQRHDLYIIRIPALGRSKWDDAMFRLLSKDVEWFSRNKVNIAAGAGTWDINAVEINPATVPPWPTEPTSKLIGTALGKNGFVSSPDHPIFSSLFAGMPV